MGKLPYIKPRFMVVCPECGHIFINRKDKCCPMCHIKLFYLGEKECNTNGIGYVFTHNGWIHLDIKVKKSKKS